MAQTETAKDEKMSLYGFRFSLSGAAEFLGLSGCLLSFLGILGGIAIIYNNLAANLCQDGPLSLCDCGLPFALFVILGNVGNFVFTSRLVLKAREKDMVGVKEDIKAGCYLVALAEAVVCLAGLTALATALTVSEAVLTVLQWASPLLYILMVILGVSKSQPRLLSAYIIFKIVHFILFVFAWLIVSVSTLIFALKYQVGLLLIIDLLLFIIIGFYYVFSTGFSVIHYNVLVNAAVSANPAPAQIKI